MKQKHPKPKHTKSQASVDFKLYPEGAFVSPCSQASQRTRKDLVIQDKRGKWLSLEFPGACTIVLSPFSSIPPF